MSKKIEPVIKNFQQRKSQDQMAFLVNCTKYLKKNNASSSQTLPKIEEEGTHPNSYYEANNNPILQPGKKKYHKERKLQATVSGEINAKIPKLNKTNKKN